MKFFLAALFGGFVSLILFLIALELIDGKWFWEGGGVHLLWILPLIWGVLGIFWFDRMLIMARDSFEEFFGVGGNS